MAQDEDIYNDEEEMEEEDEISPTEEGFMQGYKEGKRIAECPTCGKVLVGQDIYESSINGKLYRFCSQSCARKFLKK